jgi:hypothetical protein
MFWSVQMPKRNRRIVGLLVGQVAVVSTIIMPPSQSRRALERLRLTSMDVKRADGFRFLPVDGPFSAGVAAEPGFGIVRAHAPHHTPLAKGFSLIEGVLRDSGRPLGALCALELRVPKPFDRAEWTEFNAGYVAQWERWKATVDGRVPGARTNVAPEFDPPTEPCLHAFCYTVQADTESKDFVISGTAEPEGTPGGLPAYWTVIVKELETRMAALGVAWDGATETQFYATRSDHELFAAQGLPRFAELVRPGLRWFFSRPPIDTLKIEVDVRRLSQEIWVAGERVQAARSSR